MTVIVSYSKPLLMFAELPLVRKWSGKKFFKVREKLGNFILGQGELIF